MAPKYFGTDGIRGPVGAHPITAEFVLKLGWAAGVVFSESQGGTILIGKDTRISGYLFESALEAGLASAGVNIVMLGPMPTPAVAYLTRAVSAQAGIVISASHNPYSDNGIKFFSGEGRKLPDSVEMEIERLIDAPMTTVASQHLGKAERMTDAVGRYVEFCKNTFPKSMNLKGFKIVVDCAHGAAYKVPIGVGPIQYDEGNVLLCTGFHHQNQGREKGVAPDPNILHIEEHHVEIGKLGGGGFFVRAIQRMHGQTRAGVSAIRSMGSIGKVTPESVFGTKSRRDVDAQPHQGVHKVGRGTIGAGNHSSVVAHDADPLVF